MKLLQNLKKDKKGFTLIEMIVVIVIIGILLAILVPGMFKYIDRAKEKQIEVSARNAYIAAQIAIADEYSKKSPAYDNATLIANIVAEGQFTGKFSVTYNKKDKKITAFKYYEGGKAAKLDVDNEVWEVTDETAPTDSILTITE